MAAGYVRSVPANKGVCLEAGCFQLPKLLLLLPERWSVARSHQWGFHGRWQPNHCVPPLQAAVSANEMGVMVPGIEVWWTGDAGVGVT